MKTTFWQGLLVATLVISLIGSVVVYVMEPNLSSVLGIVGAFGSIIGSFAPAALQTMSAKSTPAPPEGTRFASTRFNWQAMLPAMVIGTFLGIATGILYALPPIGYFIFCPLQNLSFFLIGAIYVWVAHRELAAGQSIQPGHALLGGALAAIIPALAANSANSFSTWVLFEQYYATWYAQFYDYNLGSTVTAAMLGLCCITSMAVGFSAVTGLVTALVMGAKRS